MNLEALKHELSFRTSRSSGAGGQHVNKVETKVELRFNVPDSLYLDNEQKELITTRLAHRLTKDGVLIITNQASRSQASNKEAAMLEFFFIMEEALIPPKKRKKVKPLTADREKRLSGKRQLSEKKSLRQKVTSPKESDLRGF